MNKKKVVDISKTTKILLQDVMGILVALGFFLHIYKPTVFLVLLLLWWLTFFWIKTKPVPESGWVRWIWIVNHFMPFLFLISAEVFIFVYMIISLAVDVLVWNVNKAVGKKGAPNV